jgi:hypothetical protein
MLSLSLQFHSFFSWVVVVHDMIIPCMKLELSYQALFWWVKNSALYPGRVKSEVGCHYILRLLCSLCLLHLLP